MTHTWVEMTFTVVEPELQENGSIDIFVTEAHEAAGRDDPQHGCAICHVPLNAETINTECMGEPQ